MGSRRKRGSRKNTYRYNIDRKKLWRKAKKVPKIECTQLKQAWSEKKSVATNFAEMGLSHNANRTLKIKKTQNFIRPAIYEEQLQPKHRKPAAKKAYVADQLAEEASIAAERVYTLSSQLQTFCMKMMDKYGENYSAMAKDPRNYYQRTPKQIKGTIELFKQVQAYDADLEKNKVKGETGTEEEMVETGTEEEKVETGTEEEKVDTGTEEEKVETGTEEEKVETMEQEEATE